MNHVITIDLALWGLLVGTVLPILVGLVTKTVTRPGLKAVLLAALSALVALGQEALSAGSFEVKAFILKFALLFLTAVGLHFGLLKPVEVTSSNGLVNKVNR